MIVDLDDFAEDNHRLDLLWKLKLINPAFKVTLFAIPTKVSSDFESIVPKWCQLVAHGWTHDSVYECAEWSIDDFGRVALHRSARTRWAYGFKAPGWQISDGCYTALRHMGWWVADQHLEDARRPEGLKTYFYEGVADRWHGHIQNVCGNGLEERFDELAERVAAADHFNFCSEAVVPWHR